MSRIIIFDFDGVLADSFKTFYPLIRDGMAKIGLRLTQDQYRNFFIGNVHQGFIDFIDNKSKYIIFSKFRRDNYDNYYYHEKRGVKLFNGVEKLLKHACRNNILAIASSGKKQNIKKLLEKNGLNKLFRIILANKSSSKKNMLEKIINKLNVRKDEAVMVTDTVGDILAAQKNGLKTIAVTWGFHSKKILNSSKPDFIVDSFKDLIDKIDFLG